MQPFSTVAFLTLAQVTYLVKIQSLMSDVAGSNPHGVMEWGDGMRFTLTPDSFEFTLRALKAGGQARIWVWALVVASLAGNRLSAHEPPGGQIAARHVLSVPVVDGELDDWDDIPPALQLDDFTDLVSGESGLGADATDFGLRVWIAWSDMENRLYVAAEVTDDIHQVDRPAGTATTRIFQDDDMEVFVDADHSGGQYADFSDLAPEDQLARNGTQANHFVLAGPHEDGTEFVNFSAAGWYALPDGHYTQASITHDESTGITRYEFAFVPFDRVNVTADFLSLQHDLTPGQVLGFNLEFNDYDRHSDLFEAKWSLSGGFNAFRLSERFSDLRLLPADPSTMVQDLSWGRIKASLLP